MHVWRVGEEDVWREVGGEMLFTEEVGVMCTEELRKMVCREVAAVGDDV